MPRRSRDEVPSDEPIISTHTHRAHTMTDLQTILSTTLALLSFALVAFGAALVVTFIGRDVQQYLARRANRMHWRKLERQRRKGVSPILED